MNHDQPMNLRPLGVLSGKTGRFTTVDGATLLAFKVSAGKVKLVRIGLNGACKEATVDFKGALNVINNLCFPGNKKAVASLEG